MEVLLLLRFVKIPEILKTKGIKFKVSRLSEKQFSKALKNKLLEEARELNNTKTKDELLYELSDVLEVYDATKEES